MTTNERCFPRGGAALLALAFLCAPSVWGGGGDPYDNDAPWGMPESNQNGGSGQNKSAPDGAYETPLVVHAKSPEAAVTAAEIPADSARLSVAGVSYYSLEGKGGKSDSAPVESGGVVPTVITVGPGEDVTIEAKSGSALASGEFGIVPAGSVLEFLPGSGGDVRTAYIVFGQSDAQGRMAGIQQIVPLPLWGDDGVDLTALDAAVSSISRLRGLDTMVVLTSTTFDLESGTTKFEIEASARFEIGAIEAGVLVNTRGL